MLKKAQAQEETVSFPLAIAALAVILILLFVFILPELRKLPEREVCRLSVIAKSNSQIFGQESHLQLNCPTNIVDIRKDGIYQDDKIDKVFKKSEAQSDKEEKIKKYIAGQMYDCWYKFEKGKVDPWGDWNLGKTVHCVVCADINFDPEFSEKNKEINDFGEFLNNEPISKLSKETYSEYLGGKIEEVHEASGADLYIDTTKPHLVLFRLSDLGVGGVVSGATLAGCGVGMVGTAIVNMIPVIGQGGWIVGTGIGCVVGFAGGVYTYFSGVDEISLEANVLLLPADVVKPGYCDRLG